MMKHPLRLWLIAALLLLVFLYLVKAILLPFVVGLLVAYFLDPAADRLEAWGASRSLAAFSITVTFFLTFIIVAILLVPVLAEQVGGLLESLPAALEHAQERIMRWDVIDELPVEQVEKAKEAVTDLSVPTLTFMGGFAKGLLQSGIALLNLLSLLFITPVVAFYMLRDWDRLVAKVDTLLPRQHADTIRQQMREVDRTLSGFIRGQTNVCLMLGVFYAIGLSLVGLSFGIAVGLFTGILTFIPYVGMLFGTALGVGIALFQFGDWLHVALVLGVFAVGQIIESNFVTPRIVGDKVGLHPVWIIFGMLAGGALFGFVGVLLAVPVTAVIGVWVRFAIRQYLNSPLYTQ